MSVQQLTFLSIFPEVIEAYTSVSIFKRAQEKKLLGIKNVDLRDFATDNHGTVDDRPFGGGPGMVMKADVMYRALKNILKSKNVSTKLQKLGLGGKRQDTRNKKTKVLLMTPRGQMFDQKMVGKLGGYDELVLIAPRYEGYDERITKFVDEEICVGPYVLTGGELPALTVADAVLRLQPGVLGDDASSVDESFAKGLEREYPQYTRPAELEINGKKLTVPSVLQSGNHEKITAWRNLHRKNP